MTTCVYRPKTLPGNYLNVRLTGTKSHRNAIGARLKLEAGGRTQYRQVSGGSGFGCLPFEQHFGLSNIRRVDSLEIIWPSGLKQRVEDLPINNTIQIVEGNPSWDEVYRKHTGPGSSMSQDSTLGENGPGNQHHKRRQGKTVPLPAEIKEM